MRTKTALQRADGSGWHYGIAGKTGGHPLGRCAGHPPHPTEDEARECYGAYVREDTIRLEAGAVGWTSCEHRPEAARCPNPTKAIATYGDDGYGQVALCPDHMTVENVIAAARLAGPAQRRLDFLNGDRASGSGLMRHRNPGRRACNVLAQRT